MKHISVDVRVLDHRLHDSMPGYATAGSSGIDLCECIDNNMVIQPQQRRRGGQARAEKKGGHCEERSDVAIQMI